MLVELFLLAVVDNPCKSILGYHQGISISQLFCAALHIIVSSTPIDNNTMKKAQPFDAYIKVSDTITGCSTKEHIDCVINMVKQFKLLYPNERSFIHLLGKKVVTIVKIYNLRNPHNPC